MSAERDPAADGYITVIDRDGTEHHLAAVEGWRVMEIIRDHGLPLEGLCGGACACATCHVYVEDGWDTKLHPQTDEEIERLDEAAMVEPHSRLSCQLLFSPALDGLRVTLAPEFG